MILRLRPFAVLGAMGLLAACTGGRSGESIDLTRATLRRAVSCDDLSAALREDARSKMNRRIDAEVRAIQQGWGYGYGVNDARGGGAQNAAPPAAPSAGSASTTTTPAPAHSDTETQVKGVD